MCTHFAKVGRKLILTGISLWLFIFLLIDGHEIQMLQRFRCFEVRSEDGSNSVGHIGRRLSYINSFGPIEVSMRAEDFGPIEVSMRSFNIPSQSAGER